MDRSAPVDFRSAPERPMLHVYKRGWVCIALSRATYGDKATPKMVMNDDQRNSSGHSVDGVCRSRKSRASPTKILFGISGVFVAAVEGELLATEVCIPG